MDKHKDQRMISDILHELKFLHFKFAVDVQHVYKLLEQNTVGQLGYSNGNGNSVSNGNSGHTNRNGQLDVNFDGSRMSSNPQVLLVDGKQLNLSILKELKSVHSVLVVVVFVERDEMLPTEVLIRQFRTHAAHQNGTNSGHRNDRIHILVKPTNAVAVMDILTRYLQ